MNSTWTKVCWLSMIGGLGYLFGGVWWAVAVPTIFLVLAFIANAIGEN